MLGEQRQGPVAWLVRRCGVHCNGSGVFMPKLSFALPTSYSRSIAIHMHGASLGNYFFLPRNAVAVQVCLIA